jgi:hypothetical protein
MLESSRSGIFFLKVTIVPSLGIPAFRIPGTPHLILSALGPEDALFFPDHPTGRLL